MRADGEAVGFVAEALEVEEDGRADGQVELAAIGEVEGFTASVAVRAFADANQRDVFDAEFGEGVFDC